MQVRFATPATSETYISAKLWQHATLNCCPWHPGGGCGFARHGTYSRVKPANTRIRRWYCPKARRTVSALPDCLASHRSGTLDQCEAVVRAVEQAPSLATACESMRTDIELPGALRYITRMVRAIHSALQSIKGLFPAQFLCEPTLSAFSAVVDTPSTLMGLRAIGSRYLPQLPTPLGFNPHSNKVHNNKTELQHRTGRDPPIALVDAA